MTDRSPALDGFVAPGFERVAEAFAEAFETPETGAALCVLQHGWVVVDLWGGYADARTGRRWERDTASAVFSCTKGLMSILAARAVADGVLDYGRPVAEYWPEFAQAGKGGVLVSEVLAHRSGLSAPREPASRAQALDWDAMTALLAAQAPLWEPGTGHAYHALTHGWLVGELLRRVRGTGPAELVATELAEPLGASVHLGVPADSALDIAQMVVGEELARLTHEQRQAARPDRVDWGERALTLGGAFPLELVAPDEGFNAPAVRAAVIPGAGGIATARGLATVWSATVVETDGVRLLDAATLAAAVRPQSEGPMLLAGEPPWARWGMGFQLDSEARRYLGPTGFGHDGAGGQVGFADPTHGIGFAFLTDVMEASRDARATRIIDALRSVVG
ncbi:serine hydrolase domain-containing protein [Protaetiibacter intestinalis]|uniref:Class A beta-lactamase-related serine hydrolase n=1 Tax=Protaetiibacter intestinalis TaxID=2419774 RepID=A0A387B5B9_9MICO|nr:serine hydrolase domain-containing protein [Protaetiibacter intestinalis]AYF96938.1 class A beta-lactamase-related serine hydrolase [Protaetiibacter intestinalis]